MTIFASNVDASLINTTIEILLNNNLIYNRLTNKGDFFLFAYQPQISIKKSSSYDNIIFAGDFNIDLLYPNKDTSNHLFGLLDNFNKGSLIHIRSNKPRSFHET